jgi:hypothetical protein
MSKIRITFSGLCLFVPDTSTSPTRTVVLFPKTPVAGVPPHGASVNYGINSDALGGHQLEFPDVPKVDSALTLGNGILDLTATCGKKCYPGDLGANPSARLHGRVVLPAGSVEKIGQTLSWTVCGKTGCIMTDEVVWLIDGLTPDQLTVRIADYAGNKKDDLAVTVTGDTVELGVEHHSLSPIYGKPPCPIRAIHFPAFYAMLDNASGLALPDLENCTQQTPSGSPIGSMHYHHHHAPEAHRPHLLTPTIYTCMVAGAQPGP